jgi:hypothetical protein
MGVAAAAGSGYPEAPFDSGRFSVDQLTLSELEERSGVDFGRLKDFDFGGAASAKAFVERCPTAFTLDGGPGGPCCGLPDPALP